MTLENYKITFNNWKKQMHGLKDSIGELGFFNGLEETCIQDND